jgi:carboxyl-terminal processing protease
VTRAKIKIPTVEIKEFKNNKTIWYIALNIYWENSAKEFERALKGFENKLWIIIDLRDNWGGYLQSAAQILSNFVENWKKLVQVKWKELLDNVIYPSINGWKIYKGKIVIIINGNSASASEITAWALKDYNKAILVWTKSYWKWSVQEPFSFSDWSQLKFTVAKWFTPNWINIDKDWIKPDVDIKIKKQDYDLEECKKVWVCDKNIKEEDFKFYDRQLEESKKVLNNFIKFGATNIAVSKFLEKNPEYIRLDNEILKK